MTSDPQATQHLVELEEYRQLWAYYHRTLDERKNLFDWYFKIIGIPVTAIVLLLRLGDGHSAEESEEIRTLSACALLVVGLAGVSIYATYAKESANAGRYEGALKAMRAHWKDQFSGAGSWLAIDKCRGEPSSLPSIKLLRGLSLVVINSAILTAALRGFEFVTLPSCTAVFLFSVFVLLHLLTYSLMAGSAPAESG